MDKFDKKRAKVNIVKDIRGKLIEILDLTDALDDLQSYEFIGSDEFDLSEMLTTRVEAAYHISDQLLSNLNN